MLQLIMVLGGVGALLFAVVLIAALLPTRLSAIDNANAPFAHEGGRVKNEGCGLTEVSTAAGCTPATVDNVDHEQVSFASSRPELGLAALNGTLSVPRGLTGKRPAVLLIHGSGPQSRDAASEGDLVVRHEPFAILDALAEMLTKQGLVVLRYDKRACVKCYPDHKMDFQKFRFAHFVSDAIDALEFLATRSEVDPRALVVMGHSQGGQLAPLVAQQHGKLAAVVMLAGTIQTLEQGLIGQLQRLADVRLSQWDALGALAIRFQLRDYAECFDKLRHHYDANEMCLGGGVTQAAVKDGEEMARQALPTLKALDAPLLALQGTVDINIDPATPTTLREALTGRDAEVHYLAGVGHSLTNVYETDEPALSAQVAKVISTFLGSIAPRDGHAKRDGGD
jgi:alpha-beta hydrolase superfamily lysophospholipase